MTHLENHRDRPLRSAGTKTANPPEHELLLAAEHAPLLGERFIARHGAGAFLNGERISASSVGVLHEAIVGVADFKVGVGSEEENRVHRRFWRGWPGPA